MKYSGISRKGTSTFYVILFFFLTLFAISFIMLLLWTVFAALKPVGEFRTNKIWLPHGHIWEWSWSNIGYVFSNFKMNVLRNGTNIEIPVYEQLIYSVLYAGGCSLIGTFVPYIVAYAVANFNYKFSKLIYAVVLVVMVLPIVGSYPSEIYVLKRLRLYDTFLGIYIQKANFLGLYFLVLHANLVSVPKSFYEAAYIDGASEFRVMMSIVLPLIKNTFLTIFLLQVINYWNDYQTVLLYLPTHPTVSLGLFDLSESLTQGLNNVPMKMTGCMIVMIPTLILFLLFNEKLTGNMSMGGLKE